MSERRTDKLNRLQRLLPEGLLADSRWMEAHGYSRALRSQYVRSGWLRQIARGLYTRPGGRLLWQHVVISLQNLMDCPVAVGGRTALELHGFTHYVAADGTREVHLYADQPLPGWVEKLNLEVRFIAHNAGRLFHEQPIARGLGNVGVNIHDGALKNTDPIHGGITHLDWGQWDWPLMLSTPERAILELLDEIPDRETFHQANMLMEGLRTLSPRRLQKLLEDCKSVKVKRLFLWFAERHSFRWLNQIDRNRIDLGSGKRMLAKGGKLDREYLITVPEDLYGGA